MGMLKSKYGRFRAGVLSALIAALSVQVLDAQDRQAAGPAVTLWEAR
jgi:hypothetical protein